MSSGNANPIETLRRLVLGLLVLGLTGTAAELLLLGHFEDSWQIVPIALDGVALAVLLVHGLAGGPATVRAIRLVMLLLIVAGAIGIILHYQSNLGFQMDMDPTQSTWALFAKVMRAHAPPSLAPGVMAQLGLLGFAYTYRHPALEGSRTPGSIKGDRT